MTVLLCALCFMVGAAVLPRNAATPSQHAAASSQHAAASSQHTTAAPPPAVPEQDRIFLRHSDELRYDRYQNNNAQVLVGHVEFEHKGAHLYCDSANFFEASNSFEAWGNVKMIQGDTLSLISHYGRYDGNELMMEAAGQVELRHRTTALFTDSLCYDRYWNTGYFPLYGRMVDNETVLISDWGEYHTDTKMAMFFDNVDMKDEQFHLTTDSLHYNTQTKQAHVIGPSNIHSGENHVDTKDAYYNSDTEQAILLGRSKLINDNGRQLVADSIWHDGKAGISEAFRDVVYTDTQNKNRMTCNYGYYDDTRGYALCTDSALAMDYSQPDTLYMHADTLKLFSYNLDTDSVYRVLHAYNKVRAYRLDIQAVCDSLVYSSLDSCMTMYRDPIVWNLNQQLLGEVIEVYMKDSTVDRAHVINQAFSIEQLPEKDTYNQVSSNEMFAFFTNGEIHEAQAKDNVLVVYYPRDDSDSSYVGMVSMETSLLRMFLENRKPSRIWAPKSDGTMYPMSQIPPAKRYLEGFNWFDYIRPTSPEDVFHWRGKHAGTELKPQKRRTAPAKASGPDSRNGRTAPARALVPVNEEAPPVLP